MEQQLNNLDVIFLIIIGISSLVGIARGMTKELLSVIGWILAAAALFYLVPMLNPFTEKYIASKILSNLVTGMAVLIVFSIIWVLTADKLASVIRSSKLSALDRIFGFVFGTARGVLIVILVALMFSTLIPAETQKGAFAESQIYQQAAACVEPLKAMIPQSWVDGFKAKSESLGFGKVEEKKETDENTGNDAEIKDQNAVSKSENEETDAAKKDGLRGTFEFIDNNLEVLQQNGEKLFNQLAQPKTADKATVDEQSSDSTTDGIVSDLDKILDVLEDVVTDEPVTNNKPTAPQMKKTIEEFNNSEPTIEDVIEKEVPDAAQ
ncbi:MAG: CvpA family protein [Alphaproteobacteria bacterium]|nr:CvpA family protein [Alphaproteobacteria bacterium]